MGIAYLTTDPKPGDSDNVLLAKILQSLGGVPESGDLRNNLLRKSLEQWGGSFSPGDWDHRILWKILESLGGVPRLGDRHYNLLWKILEDLGGVPRLGDTHNNLLRKILERVLVLAPVNAAVNSFVTRAGISSQTQIDALLVLVEAAIAHGWWDLCDLIYPHVGATAGAHAQNLKSSNFTVTWAGAVTHNVNGITGDGATGYGDTGYNLRSSGQITLNSGHVGVYQRTLPTGAGGKHIAGAAILGDAFFGVSRAFSGAFTGNVNELTQSSLTNSVGFGALSRISSTGKSYFLPTGSTTDATSSINTVNLTLFLLARNLSGVMNAPSNGNVAGLTVGSGITSAIYQLMKADWQTFNTANGRQV